MNMITVKVSNDKFPNENDEQYISNYSSVLFKMASMAYALTKAHKSLRSFSNVAFEMVPVFV